MRNRLYINLFLLFWLLPSCVGNRDTLSILDAAEAVMQNRPDSALSLLQSLNGQQIPRGALQAHYALLYTQALDKNYLPLSSDSLINIAVEYYRQKKDKRRLGWALFYQGSVYSQMDSIKLAITMYDEVQELLKKYPDDELLSLVAGEKGALYQKQRHFTEALDLYRASLSACRKSGNEKNENYALGRLGDVFYLSKISMDSAACYYNQAKELAFSRGDTAYSYFMDMGIITVLRAKKEYHKAMEVLMDVIQQMHGQHISPLDYYPILSMLFLDLQQIDSARHYMLVVLEDTLATATHRAGALAALKTIEERAGNAEISLLYASQYKTLSDSIQLMHIAQDLRVVEGEYQQQKLTDIIVSQRILSVTLIIGIVIVSAACVLGIVLWWKKRMVQQKEYHTEIVVQKDELLRRSSLLKGWNHALLIEKYRSKVIDLTVDANCAKVISTATHAYPGLIEWLKRYPLNKAETALVCMLLSNFAFKELCPFFKTPDPRAIYTRCSRLYTKLGIKTDPKDPHSFMKSLINLYVQTSM